MIRRLLVLLMIPLVLQAEPVQITVEEARARLLLARPDLPVRDIKISKLEGFFEVTMEGGMTLYLSSNADYFFAGDLYYVRGMDGLLNATEVARLETRKEILSGLDDSGMIVFAPPKGLTKATITVFTDIDCGYCRKLHQEVPELNRLGIAVRYLGYPRAGIDSVSYDKLVSAWCADNPNLALTQAKAGRDIEHKSCPNPVAEHYNLGGAFGVSGTPAVIYENGTLQPGYLPADQIASRLGIN